MEADHRPLLSPATATAATTTTGATTTSTTGVAPRILLVLVIGLVSTWAHQEASKGFTITVANDMSNTPLGEKFSLFYVSNDEVTRVVQFASDFVTRVLYPGTRPGPGSHVDRVDIRLINRSMTHDHVVGIGEGNRQYVVFLSPRVMENPDFRVRVKRAILKGMAEVLLSGAQNGAPNTMLDGMVEYVSNLAGFGPEKLPFKLRDRRGNCWDDEDPELVGEFLGYCEGRSEGFIGRLNEATRQSKWDEEALDRALGMPVKHLCESFMAKIQGSNMSDSVSSYR